MKVNIFFILFLLMGCGSGSGAGMPPTDPTNPTPPTPGQYQDPSTLTAPQQAAILARYGWVDPTHQVRTALLENAIEFYDINLALLTNHSWMGVVDFSLPSSAARLYLVNMQTGAVQSVHVAHGLNSDPNDTGYATIFSNVDGSLESSIGYYVTGATYVTSDHGTVLTLYGVSDTDSNALERGILLHGADYVSDQNVIQGRSWGCFAVPYDDRDNAINSLVNGAEIYAHN